MDLSQKTDIIQSKLRSLGINNVYFEPPQTIKIAYPCAIFHRGTISSRSADNRTYKKDDSYDLQWICREPDSEMVHTILEEFRMIRHIRHFTADGLHHDQFKLFY